MENEQGEMRRSGAILRGIGMLLLFLGMFLFIMTMFPFLYGLTLDPIFSTIGLGLGFIGFILIFISMFLRTIKKYETFSFLKCTKEFCTYEEVRDFRKNDFVFKELERKCKKCSSPLYINQIAHLPLKRYDEKKYPIKDKKFDKEKEVFITKTVVKCDSPECSFEVMRDFQDGDVIFKHLEDMTCKKCGSGLIIGNIFHISEEDLKELIEVKA